jgi:hypothetical protein
MSQAPGVPPSGFGDAVDRDVAKIRDATATFKTTEALPKGPATHA